MISITIGTQIKTPAEEIPKLACFDFDWTLVKPKNGKQFPTDSNDWQYLRNSVPEILHQFVHDGYSIIIFTNQTKEWKVDMIKNVFHDIGINATVYIAMGKDSIYAKPNILMFTENIKEWDKENSFYCGDAYDADKCWSDSDKVFADKIGIKFCTPEELFPFDEWKYVMTNYSKPEQEIIIMVGYPASGKSTTCIGLAANGYEIISGDVLKTPAKMIKTAIPFIMSGKSVVFDATHGTIEKRKQIIDLANKYGISVRIFVTQFTMEEAMELNIKRAFHLNTKPISKIAYYTYRKKYQPPTESEAPIFYIPKN